MGIGELESGLVRRTSYNKQFALRRAAPALAASTRSDGGPCIRSGGTPALKRGRQANLER